MWAWAEGLAWQLREGRLLPPEEAQGHVPTALWLSLDGLESLLSSSEALAAALGGHGNSPALQVPATFPEQHEKAFRRFK